MAVFSTGDSVSAVVADIGSYASKIGFAGEDYPRAYFRSVRVNNLVVGRDVATTIELI
jgi:actin-related protein